MNLKQSLERFYLTGDIKDFYDQVFKIVVLVCQRYSVSYSPYGFWDLEAFKEVSQDLMVRLLSKEKLREYKDLNLDNNVLYSIIEKSIKNLLIDVNRKRFPETARVRKLVKNLLLEEPEFVQMRSPNETMTGWGLSIWDSAAQFTEPLSDALEQIQHIKYHDRFKGRLQLYQTKRIMIEIFMSLDSSLPFEMLVQLIKEKVKLQETATESLDEVLASLDAGVPFCVGVIYDDDWDSQTLIDSFGVFELLSPIQLKIWRYLYDGLTLEKIAKLLSCSKSKIAYQRDRVFEVIHENLSDPELLKSFEENLYREIVLQWGPTLENKKIKKISLRNRMINRG